MKQLFINKNITYLNKIGISISNEIVLSTTNNEIPALDDLIDFSNNSGISINDFLFVDIEQNNRLG